MNALPKLSARASMGRWNHVADEAEAARVRQFAAGINRVLAVLAVLVAAGILGWAIA